MDGWAWSGTVADFLAQPAADFLAQPAADWLAAVVEHQAARHRERPTRTQKAAWADAHAVLTAALRAAADRDSSARGWTLAFEYELAWEGGRRADLVVLAGPRVVVVEFKQLARPTAAAADQLAAYARDLELYHAATHGRPVATVLALTRRKAAAAELADALLAARAAGTGPDLDPAAWLNAEYAPLPSVVAAARRVFADEPLPHIRRAASAGIPQVLRAIDRLVARAAAKGERHLVLITGVPGAGKTLVGLSAVHAHGADAKAVYLTGNGPLVEVLRYALGGKAFVRPVRNFYLQYEARGPKVPREHLFVFDEAQRAWDAERMGEKYGITKTAGEAVLGVADRAPGWAVVVGLIGEGQEIHVGEEAGPEQWAAGVRASANPWHVHCPPRLATLFADLTRVAPAARYDLDTSLRSHRAAGVQAWAAAVLDGDFAAAKKLAPRLAKAGFAMYLTRDLEAAKAYLRERYAGEPEKTFGLVASSRARDLPRLGVPSDYPSTQRVEVGPWYVDPAESPRSCRQLDAVVTEFGCQGLELDGPLVCWGNDLLWDGAGWRTSTRQPGVKDPRRLRLNSYRVLLTRGRDGMVVFVPPTPEHGATAAALSAAGLQALPANGNSPANSHGPPR
jgi:hypothetical protein